MIDNCDNPWLGLSSYQTSDSFRFFGREREMEEIGASIKDNYCTILYGVSGAGKTSIINAGLRPKLSAEGYLPIIIRLDHNGQSYSDQIISACFNTFEQTGTEYECPFDTTQIQSLDARDSLWIFFHASTFWSKDNRKVVPVLFIDQFEELFTLAGSEDQINSFFQQIDSLFGSVPSERLISQIESSNTSFDFYEKPQFRMVLSMREDFLARLEDYCYNIPVLRKNRIGLRKMNGFQALDVIMKPQKGLVAEDVALKIVSTVTGKDCSSSRTNLQMLTVDTSILSLFCSELYQLAAEKNTDVITSDIVEAEGGDIIKQFYEKNVSKLSRRGRRYLEQHLLTSNGYRNQLAVEDINRSIVKNSDIQALESSRIIRKEIINGTERIEFTHDILCKAAMDSMHKAKKRNTKLSSIISYAAFTLVCSYIVIRLILLIDYNFFLFNSRSIYADGMAVWTYIRHLLMFFFGFLFLPLSIPLSKKKNKFIDICLIVLCLYLYYFPAYYVPYLFGSILLLSIVPVINICSRTPQITFKDYCKSVFQLPLKIKDKWASVIVYLVLILGTCKLLRELHFAFFQLANSTFVVIIANLLASIVIFLLFYFISNFIHFGKKKKASLLMSILQVGLIFFYLISQYLHSRWISYISLVVLLTVSLCWLRVYSISFWKKRIYIKLFCSSIAAVSLLIFAANYVSNINILALKDNARALENKHCWNQTKIISRDGHYGIMEGSEIIVPPLFKSISEDYINQWQYSIHSNTSIVSQLLKRKIYNYRVCDDNGVYSSWKIMEHPEIDNRYTRMIPKYDQIYRIEPYLTSLAVEYYYQKAVVEAKIKYQKDFSIASEHLFLLNCVDILFREGKGSLPTCIQIALGNTPPRRLEDILKSDSTDYFECRLESPNTIYYALKGIINSKAIRSEAFLESIARVVDSYADTEHYLSKAKCKGLLCLIQGKYDEAINYAKISSDDETLAEAMILSGEIDDTDLINNLVKRTNEEGRFIGEAIVENIGYLVDDNMPQDMEFLNDYSLLPKKYKESVSLVLSKVRRTMLDGKVLFIESGKIISEYQKIVYPSNKDTKCVGVYFKDGKRGFIDWEGHEITDAKFDHAWLFSEYNGLAVVEVDGKIGFINSTGNYTVYPRILMQDELRYYKDWIFEADGNLVFPETDRKFGLLDSNGKWISYPQYGEIGDYTYGFRIFGDSESGKYGLLNRNGQEVIPQEYQQIDVDSKFIEVRDSKYVITCYEHDGNSIIGKVKILERTTEE